MPSRISGASADVFLNIPYDASAEFEALLVAYTASLVAIGRRPRLTFELPDDGAGRMRRIFALLRSCPVSFHDLSAVELPVRFNMPFELGLACALRETGKGRNRHRFHIFDSKPYQLQIHLSDLNALDPKIHGGKVDGVVKSVLDILDKPGGAPSARQVLQLYREMNQLVPILKDEHRRKDLFGRKIYGELVALGTTIARDRGL
jgi:hypothetical protein